MVLIRDGHSIVFSCVDSQLRRRVMAGFRIGESAAPKTVDGG